MTGTVKSIKPYLLDHVYLYKQCLHRYRCTYDGSCRSLLILLFRSLSSFNPRKRSGCTTTALSYIVNFVSNSWLRGTVVGPANFHGPTLDLQLMSNHLCG